MNLHQRLTNLEQRSPAEPHGIPVKPNDWTDGEHIAVVKGLGITGYPIMTLVANPTFIEKYQTYIDQIRADYNKHGVTPDKPLIKAEPMTYNDIIEYQKAKYGI